MFSYLRPRSRQGVTNLSETSESTKNPQSVSDFQSRFPPSPQKPPPPPPPAPIQDVREEEPYVSPVSSRAPILPPIPRVASVYGPPEGLTLPEEHQNGKLQEPFHSRVGSIEEEKVQNNFGTSPKSAAPITGIRPRGNFSRPFHGRDVSLTPSEERANLQEIWRTAAQTAQSTEPSQPRGKRPSISVNSTTAQQYGNGEASSSSSGRTPRMPFQSQRKPESKHVQSPNSANLSAPGPHFRQASEGSINQAHRDNVPYAGLTQAKSSDSQLSLPIARTKEVTPPQQSKQASNTTTQSKPSRFTRLNPMSLLTRRRSSQPTSQPENDNYRRHFMLGSTLPQDYVGIRGTRVHDFGAPKPRKVISQQTMASGSTDRSPDGTSDLLHARTKSRDENSSFGVPSPSPERKSESPRVITPAFKQNIEDEGKEPWRYDQDNSRNQDALAPADISSTEYTDSDYDSDSEDEEAPRDPLLLGDPTFGLFSAPDDAAPPQEFSFIVPEHLAGPPPPRTPRSRSQTPNHDRMGKGKSYHPPPAPRTPRSRSQTPTSQERSPRDPRAAPRSASTPPLRESRTPSPQLIHLPRHSKSNASRFSFDMAGFGSSVQEKLLEDKHRQKISKDLTTKISKMSVPETEDGMDSDDPDFGEDFEEEIPGMNIDEDDFPMASSIANSTLDSVKGKEKAVQEPKPSLYTHQNATVEQKLSDDQAKVAVKPSQSFILRSSMFPSGAIQATSGDDFYFDDGVIEDADLAAATEHFDESVFDDPTYRPGQHLQSSLPVVQEQRSQESSLPSTRPMSQESANITGHGLQPSTDTSRTSLPPIQPWEKATAVKRSSMLKNDLSASREVQTSLTHGNLAAYHDALALAAQKAATEGRFDREAGGEDTSSPAGKSTSQANLDVNNTHGPQVDELIPYDDLQERVTFDDYEQEDDDVIAEANADALGYDEEFYGEEFHFYSKGDGAGESQYGGFFVNDIKRSHSGRANGQEPSLTPITEMSEWSTRNSMVSLAMDRGYASAVQQPGLAQIADSLQDGDDDLSMSSLKRLRQSAFAGSASSLGSGGSGKNSSPPGSSSQMIPRPGTGHNRSQSDRSHPLRIQTTDQDNNKPLSPQAAPEFSPGIRRPFVKGHSRNSSGAESVAYVQETDTEGSRWVLERRRTTEDGSIEVLGRQVVEGGRI